MQADPVVGFARALREAGMSVPTDTVVTFARALDAVDLSRPDLVYWAGRSTLVRSPVDIAIYDRVFAGFWGAQPPAHPVPTEQLVRVAAPEEAGDDGGDGDGDGEPGPRQPGRRLRVTAVV